MKYYLIKIIDLIAQYLGVLFIPLFGYYAMETYLIKGSAFYVYVFSIILYILLVVSVLIYLGIQSEKIAKFIDGELDKFRLTIYVLFVVFILSLTFASYYSCIYKYDPNSFSKVNGDNFIERYINFFYYSLGIFLMNGNSSIEASSKYAILFSSTEMISSFIAIVLILTNYQSLNKNR